MKRIIYLAMMFNGLMSATSWASLSQSFDGIYAGAEFGGAFSSANQKIQNDVILTIESNLFTSTQSYSNYSSMVRYSAAGALFTGYGRSWKKIYLSSEVSLANAYYNMANSSNTGLSQTSNPGDLIIANSNEMNMQVNLSPVQLGLFLRPGLLITPSTLLFARIGTSFATASYYTKVNASKILTVSSETTVFPLTLQGKKSRQIAALQLGTGIEQGITKQLTLRFDYLFSYYGKTKFQQSAGTETNFESMTFNLSALGYQSISIYSRSFMLGLVYHFTG